MTYEKLKKVGTKVHEDDFYDNGLYLFTISYWVHNGTLYRHEEHPNQLRYTGRTTTERCSESEADYYIEHFPDEESKKCVELMGKYIQNRELLSIKDRRIAAGLTQKQFSELFTPPIPINTIKKWDSGQKSPSPWAEGLIIEKLERIKKMEITEKNLLDNYEAVTNGASIISKIDGNRIFWDYRRGSNGDGYNPARLKREDANEISLDNGATIELDNECREHPALEKIRTEFEKMGIL